MGVRPLLAFSTFEAPLLPFSSEGPPGSTDISLARWWHIMADAISYIHANTGFNVDLDVDIDVDADLDYKVDI